MCPQQDIRIRCKFCFDFSRFCTIWCATTWPTKWQDLFLKWSMNILIHYSHGKFIGNIFRNPENDFNSVFILQFIRGKGSVLQSNRLKFKNLSSIIFVLLHHNRFLLALLLCVPFPSFFCFLPFFLSVIHRL